MSSKTADTGGEAGGVGGTISGRWHHQRKNALPTLTNVPLVTRLTVSVSEEGLSLSPWIEERRTVGRRRGSPENTAGSKSTKSPFEGDQARLPRQITHKHRQHPRHHHQARRKLPNEGAQEKTGTQRTATSPKQNRARRSIGCSPPLEATAAVEIPSRPGPRASTRRRTGAQGGEGHQELETSRSDKGRRRCRRNAPPKAVVDHRNSPNAPAAPGRRLQEGVRRRNAATAQERG